MKLISVSEVSGTRLSERAQVHPLLMKYPEKKFHSYARLKTKGHWHQLRAIVKISENHPNYCHNSDKVQIFRDRASGDPMEIFSQLPPETETSILETACFV